MTLITASGSAVVVVRHVREALDLPDHVVAEESHDPAVERREVGERSGSSTR